MKHHTTQLGITLIEVLVTVVVVGVGLSAVAGLSITNVRTTAQGQVYTQATIIADELADTMRANMLGYEGNKFSSNPEGTEKVCMNGNKCKFDEQAQYDGNKWLTRAAATLPGGVAAMCMDSTPDDGQPDDLACDGVGLNTIKLFWVDGKSTETLGEGESFQRYTLAITP